MASVTAIMNEVTGDCGERIKVSVNFTIKVKKLSELACLWVKRLIFLERESGSGWQRTGVMVPSIGSLMGCFEGD